MPDQHAYLSPSGAKLWLQSPACWYKDDKGPLTEEEQAFIEQFRPRGTAAEEGTLGHEIAERLLRKEFDKDPSKTRPLRKIRKSKYYSYDLERRARWSFNEARDIIDRYDDAEVYFELRVGAPSIHKELWGTSDVVIVAGDVLHIVDFKFGRLPVHAEDNPQLKIYAYAALDTLHKWDRVKTVRATILQPRDYDVDEMETTARTLHRYGQKTVKPAARATYDHTGKMRPSLATCRYCKHRVTDQKHRRMFMRAINYKEGQSVNDLDMKQIEEIAANAATLKAWIDDVVSYAQAKAYGGYPFKKLKLVRGYSRRSFKDGTRVKRRLKRMGYDPAQYMAEPQVKPLTEIEALLGKTKFNAQLGELITSSENRPRLVPTTDKGRPVQKTSDEVADEFGL